MSLSIFAAGCKKKVAVARTPAPPPPVVQPAKPAEKPRISQFEAEPGTIEKGQAATLRWAVVGETTSITISPGIGNVAATGNRQVFPSSSSTYTLTATGPGGTDTATANVTINAAPAPPPVADRTPAKSLSELLASTVTDVYFDYDKYDIREDARGILARDADSLKAIFAKFPNASIVIEGHADERGSAEYNLGLSDRRATATRDFLVQLGVPGDRLKPVSFGKERPQCTDSNETCWQSNRRAHFAAGQ
ncbi:MAG TPA: OmpA family protein [Bryobacteraceae bacterium]|nr:OmpA family protein [Bryobacteraceae bacterium]